MPVGIECSDDTVVCKNNFGLQYRLFKKNLSNWSVSGLYFEEKSVLSEMLRDNFFNTNIKTSW
jgi:hypothetical protein